MQVENKESIEDLKQLINTEDVDETDNESGIELKKERKKYQRTKPFVQSDKQKEVWERSLMKRKENNELKKKMKEDEKLSRKKELEDKMIKKVNRIKKKQEKENKLLEVSDDESVEPEIIVKKVKKPKKKIIVVEESDDEDNIKYIKRNHPPQVEPIKRKVAYFV
jgi:hypothetical protein